jgi:hypothetical protein
MKSLVNLFLLLAVMSFCMESFASEREVTICTHTKNECYQACKNPTKVPFKDETLCPQDSLQGEWACTCAPNGGGLPTTPNEPAGFTFMGCMYTEGCNTQLCSGRSYRYFFNSELCDYNMIACYCSEN